MNRATALLVAVGLLLAHTLAIHIDPSGRLGSPYDVAHVACRIGRNITRLGVLGWEPDGSGGGLEAYPSPLWLLVSVIAERFYWSPTNTSQVTSLLAALVTVWVSGRVARRRVAGVLPPTLLVVSGAFAASALGGTEHSTTALMLVTVFVAGEHRRPLVFAVACAALALLRPEGALMAILLCSYAIGSRRQANTRPPLPLWSVLAPGAALLLYALLPTGEGGSLLLLHWRQLLTLDRVQEGGLYLWHFTRISPLPWLLVFPLGGVLTLSLSAVGFRALLLALVYAALTVLAGGGPHPFGLALVPALPLAAIAVQEGMLPLLDSRQLILERLVVLVCALAVIVSILASRFPGDLGPVAFRGLHSSWVQLEKSPAYGTEPRLAREALEQELRIDDRMRSLGTFLRDTVGGSELSLLTPWPGALGYLSDIRVIDWFGRVGQDPSVPPNPSWLASPRSDLVTPLEARPELVLPGVISVDRARRGALGMGVDSSLFAFDLDATSERASRISAVLREYELVTLPIQANERGTPRPFYLMRRRDLGFTPSLKLERVGQRVRVELVPSTDREPPILGHPQLVTLQLLATDDEGNAWFMDPRGQMFDERRVDATGIVQVDPRELQKTRLAELFLHPTPNGTKLVRIEARLLNPGVRGKHPLAQVGEQARLQLRR